MTKTEKNFNGNQNKINKEDKQKNLILNGNLWKVMFHLSWPAIIAMVLYGLNAVIDGIFVGNFVGETALAGVALAYPLTQITFAFGSLIGVGAASALSIAIGANNKKTQTKILGSVNTLSLIFSIMFGLLAFVFATPLIQMMGGNGEALSLGVEYFRITLIGTLFIIYGLSTNMIIRGEGKMKLAAVIMGIGLVLNILSNYLFIVLLKMGVAGAAWGTNTGMFIYAILGLLYFAKGKVSFKSKPFSFNFDGDTIRTILRLGFPSLIMSIMSLLQAVVVFNTLSIYGTSTDIAFYGVVYRIFTLMITPLFGLMRALQPVAGINFGAKNYDRVIKSFKVFLVAALVVAIPPWIVALQFPNQLLNVMIPNQIFDQLELIYFQIYIAIVPLLSIIFLGMTFFPAINKAKPAMLLGIVRQLVFYIPTMILLPMVIGISGVYYGSFIIDFIIVLWSTLLLRKEFKNLRSLKSLNNGVDSINSFVNH